MYGYRKRKNNIRKFMKLKTVLEKRIIFISSSSSFAGESLINFYKKKYFIISYSENTKFYKNKNHININNS